MDDGGRRSPHPFGARRLHPSRAPSPPAAPLIVAVVIPVFNERASLPLVVGDIPRALVREIVVVDNGTTDDTGLVARDLPVRLVREPRRGYGSACLAGIAALESSPPDVVVFLDGDYSDHPEELPLLTAAIVPLLVPLYDTTDPTLFGFPFYYWFQLALIPAAVVLTVIAYYISKGADREDRESHGTTRGEAPR